VRVRARHVVHGSYARNAWQATECLTISRGRRPDRNTPRPSGTRARPRLCECSHQGDGGCPFPGAGRGGHVDLGRCLGSCDRPAPQHRPASVEARAGGPSGSGTALWGCRRVASRGCRASGGYARDATRVRAAVHRRRRVSEGGRTRRTGSGRAESICSYYGRYVEQR